MGRVMVKMPAEEMMDVRADKRRGASLTAVVVNWNTGEHLVRCVEALLAERGRLDLEVVVVDNASSDGSLEGLERFSEDVRVIQTGENLGFGRGVNRGMRASERPYLLAINPDVRLRPGALARMVVFLEAETSAGLVGPRLVDVRDRVRTSCGMAPRLGVEVCHKFLLHLVLPFLKFGRRRPGTPSAVDWVTGACFVARRSVLEAASGLDEAIFMYYEDVDLCLRVRQAGWGVYYLPEAEGVHAGGQSSKQALERMLMVSEASYAYFIRKHLGGRAAALLATLRPLEMGLRILLWSGLFLVLPGRREEARARLKAYRKILAQGADGGSTSHHPGGIPA